MSEICLICKKEATLRPKHGNVQENVVMLMEMGLSNVSKENLQFHFEMSVY